MLENDKAKLVWDFQLNLRKTEIFMHKVANGKYLEKISNLFVEKNNDNYNLRNNGIDYTLEKPRTNFLKKALVIVGQKCGTSYR